MSLTIVNLYNNTIVVRFIVFTRPVTDHLYAIVQQVDSQATLCLSEW